MFLLLFFFFFKESLSEYKTLIFPYNGIYKDTLIDVIKTISEGIFDIIQSFIDSGISFRTIYDYIGYFQPIYDEDIENGILVSYNQTNYELIIQDFNSSLSEIILKFIENGSLSDFLNETFYESEEILFLKEQFSFLDLSKPFPDLDFLFPQHLQKHFEDLNDLFLSIGMKPTLVKPFLDTLNDKYKKNSLTINDFLKLFDLDLSIVSEYGKLLSNVFNPDYTLLDLIQNAGFDLESYKTICSIIRDIIQTQNISYSQIKTCLLLIKEMSTPFIQKSKDNVAILISEIRNILTSFISTYTFSERLDLALNSLNKIDNLNLCDISISDENYDQNFYCVIHDLKVSLLDMQNGKTDIYDSFIDSFGEELTDFIFDTTEDFLTGGTIWDLLNATSNLINDTIADYFFNGLISIQKVITLLSQENAQIYDILKTVVDQLGIPESQFNSLWSQIQEIAQIISQTNISIFDNINITNKQNETFILDEIIRNYLDEMKDIINMSFYELLGDYSEDFMPVFQFLDNFVHNSSTTIDYLFQLYDIPDLSIEVMCQEAEKYLIYFDDIISDDNFFKPYIYQPIEGFLSWFKDRSWHITFNSIFSYFSDKEWDYNYGESITINTTVRTLLAYIPKDIIDAVQTWEEIANLETPSLPAILGCLVKQQTDEQPNNLKRKALSGSVQILRSFINSVQDIGPKFDDGTVKLKDFGFDSFSNISFLADYVNNLTLYNIINQFLAKGSTEIINECLVFVTNLRNNTISMENIYNLMKYANEFFGNNYVISDPPHETSFNKTVLILILCFVITMFIILIIISTIFRIKYFKNNSLNEELNSKSDTSQTSFANLI